MVQFKFYDSGLVKVLKGELQLMAGDIKVLLVGAGYVPNVAHTVKTDIGANEIAGTGYVAGGKALTTKSIVTVDAKAVFKCDNISWDESTLEARYGVVYEATSNALLGYIDFEKLVSTTNGTLRIATTEGLFKVG